MGGESIWLRLDRGHAGATGWVSDPVDLLLRLVSPTSVRSLTEARLPAAYGPSVTQDGVIAVACEADHNLQLVDARIPDRPQSAGTWSTAGQALGAAVARRTLWIATGGSLDGVDIADPGTGQLIGRVAPSGLHRTSGLVRAVPRAPSVRWRARAGQRL